MKGNYHDNNCFEKHINDTIYIITTKKKNIKIIADKAYSSKKNYELLERNNISHIIPPKKNMKLYNTYKYDKNLYKVRIKIEHIFARLKAYKRINIRYDKKIKSFTSFVYIALSIIAINIVNS